MINYIESVLAVFENNWCAKCREAKEDMDNIRCKNCEIDDIKKQSYFILRKLKRRNNIP